MGRLNSKRKFLVTGGLGFIGSHFIERALNAGHDVSNIDKETYAAHVELNQVFEQLAAIKNCSYRYLKKDIAEVCFEDIPDADFIVNFAAESHVDASISDSDAFMRSNVIGVHNLLDLLRRHKLHCLNRSWAFKMPVFVQISTDEVLGDIIAPGAFKEDDRHRPSNPYSATKSAAESLVVAWSRTYDIPFIITRTTNNYGPRQHPEKLVPMAITKLTCGNKAIMHGDGSYIRNWIHVLDNVDAIWTLIDRGELCETYHISSDEEYSVRDILARICDLLHKDFDKSVDRSIDRSGADVRYALDCTKLKALGWKPTRAFDETLKKMLRV